MRHPHQYRGAWMSDRQLDDAMMDDYRCAVSKPTHDRAGGTVTAEARAGREDDDRAAAAAITAARACSPRRLNKNTASAARGNKAIESEASIQGYAVMEELAIRIHPLFGCGSPPTLAAKQRLNWAKVLLEAVVQSPAAVLDIDVATLVGACLNQSVRDAHGRTLEMAAAAAAPFNVLPSVRASDTARRLDETSDDTRYKFIKTIGHDVNGAVRLFRDSRTENSVMVRQIQRAWEDTSTVKRTLRELLLLRHLSHRNLIGLIDVWPSPPEGYGAHVGGVYVIAQALDCDLHRIIRSGQELTEDHYQYFMYQLLCGLKFMHSAELIHCDLKPASLYVNKNCDLRIGDCEHSQTARELARMQEDMDEYVVMRWYRPPELLLTRDYREPSIDIWTAGCILAELIARRPLFPGTDYVDQLHRQLQHLGSPSDDDMSYIASEKARTHVKHYRQNKLSPIGWDERLPAATPGAIALLDEMVRFDPRKRLSAAQCIEHSWLEEYADPDGPDEAPCNRPFHFDPLFAFEAIIS